MKTSTKYTDVWLLRDAYKSPVSVCKSKENAKKQLLLLAKFEAENRNTKISKEYETSIVFENFDSVDMINLPLRNTLKTFAKTMGFGYLITNKERKE